MDVGKMDLLFGGGYFTATKMGCKERGQLATLKGEGLKR